VELFFAEALICRLTAPFAWFAGFFCSPEAVISGKGEPAVARRLKKFGRRLKAAAEVADIPRSMRKKFLMIVVVLTVALVSNYLGFARGFTKGVAKGSRLTNIWWVEQKSVYYDTHEIIQKRQLKKHDCL
jgi:hypothetical protein